MAKLYLGTREVTPVIYNQSDMITVTNTTGAAINKDAKVWINKVGNTYSAVNFATTSEDFTAEGSLTIDSNGIASGFSASNYIYVGKPLVNSTQITTKAYITDFSTYNILINSLQSEYSSLYIEPSTQRYSLFDGGHSAYVAGTTPLQTNKWYWFGYRTVGTTHYGYVLEDNGYTIDTLPDISNWSLEWTTSYNIFNGDYFNIGSSPSISQYVSGMIDLKNTKIDTNGLIWTPFVTSVNVNENSITGIAAENIASSATGNVYVLGE